MAKTSRWEIQEAANGMQVVEFSSWKWFYDFIRQEMLAYSEYVWRGQRDAAWGLESSFDRAMRFKPKKQYSNLADSHLERFKMAARGRRGHNPSKIVEVDDWWALAQHYGMATPLLDWTESPFAALYFAFEKDQEPSSKKRAIWALGPIEERNRQIRRTHEGLSPEPTLTIIRPLQDENSRLVSQAGLFTRAPYGETVETWIHKNYNGVAEARLLKFVIPNRERPDCLRTLDKMNINHLSLFPDLYGAGQHCNKKLTIEGY